MIVHRHIRGKQSSSIHLCRQLELLILLSSETIINLSRSQENIVISVYYASMIRGPHAPPSVEQEDACPSIIRVFQQNILYIFGVLYYM